MAGEDHGFVGEAFPADGIASASCRRNRGSTPPRTCSATSRKASPRSGRFSIATTRSTPSSARRCRRTRWTRSWQSKARSRMGSRPRTAGTSTRASSSPWTRCACRRRMPTSQLSGGERRRVALCRCCCSARPLASRRAHQSPRRRIGRLAGALPQGLSGTVVAVTHDRYFLDNVAGWILELDRGPGIPWEGNYSSWLEQKQKRLSGGKIRNEAPANAAARARLDSNVAARAPGQRQGASQAYEELLSEETAQKSEQIEIYIPPGPRLGDIVVEARGLRKGYGDQLLMDDIDFTLPRGGIVGVIGPNGAGKTTLFRMITGQEQPDGGTLRLARRSRSPTSISHATRSAPTRPSGKRSRAASTKSSSGSARSPRAPTCRGSTSRAAINSGRSASSRAASAIASTWPSCSSPAATCCCSTNRQTISTSTRCARWKKRLLSFAGCAVVISHDRWFLDRIATHMLAFEGDSKVVWFEGNYQDYEADRKRRLGAEADQPHRVSTGS